MSAAAAAAAALGERGGGLLEQRARLAKSVGPDKPVVVNYVWVLRTFLIFIIIVVVIIIIIPCSQPVGRRTGVSLRRRDINRGAKPVVADVWPTACLPSMYS